MLIPVQNLGDIDMGSSHAASPSLSEDSLVNCESCGALLLRFPAGRFMRASDRSPRACIIVCAECGNKNSWTGSG